MPCALKLPKPYTVSFHLLELVAVSGEVPVNLLYRIAGGNSYKPAVVTALKHQGLLRTYYRNGLRGLRLSAAAKKLLYAQNTVRFGFSLAGQSDTNHVKSDLSRRVRLHRIAETIVTMHNAGVSVFRDKKPPVFAPELDENAYLNIREPAFYNSREIKEVGTDFVKIKGARSVGILLTASNIYTVYNLGGSLMKWEYKSEMRTKALLKTVLCRERMTQYSAEDIKGVIFGDGMELCFEILSGAGGKQYFVLDGNYENFYYLTNDRRGERILTMLCNPPLSERLKQILMSDLQNGDSGFTVENDAFEQDGRPVLFGFFCDLPRIRRFDTALRLREIKGEIICFDFQRDSLSRYCWEEIEFKTIDFEKWERSFF